MCGFIRFACRVKETQSMKQKASEVKAMSAFSAHLKVHDRRRSDVDVFRTWEPCKTGTEFRAGVLLY